jgi:hypothetical protein
MRAISTVVSIMAGCALLGCNDAGQQATEPRVSSVEPAAAAPANAKVQDQVTGSGSLVGIGDNSFAVRARSGPAGENPKGHLSVQEGGVALHNGKVTCLAVAGNRAVVGSDFNGGIYLLVVDNGDPADGIPDQAQYLQFLPTDACDEVLATFTDFTLFPIDGDVVVVDAP